MSQDDERDSIFRFDDEALAEHFATAQKLMDDLERSQRAREAERMAARFGRDGKLVKRPQSRNRQIAEVALVKEKLGPHAELWITYSGAREEALALRADPELAGKLSRTIELMDPEALNGYVAFEKRHAPSLPAGDKNLVQYIPVHGGITYAEKDDFAAVWGFDTMHYGSENQPRADRDWIRANCWILYRGLLLAEKRWKEFSRAGRDRRAAIAQELLDLVPEQPFNEKLGFTALINTLAGNIG